MFAGKRFSLFLMIGVLLPVFGSLGQTRLPVARQAPVSPCELVVLANHADPYHLLAQEIAAAESAPLVETLDQVLACQPLYLLWVVSPAWLSQSDLVAYGRAVNELAEPVSTGLLTASTLEGARQLWQRGKSTGADYFVAVNAANPAAHIDESRLVSSSKGYREVVPLTKDNFLAALQEAYYLSFTGHGGRNYLSLAEGNAVTPADIPELAGVLVSTVSCQTFQPWEGDSIARRIVDQGAAAYAGFVFSPNEGYVLGEFEELPFRYTWAEFPIGHVLQVQNRATRQGFASFPFLFLLGDPRIALQEQAPYEVAQDERQDGARVIQLRDAPAGVVPIRIQDGAAYRFVRIPGVAAAGEGDPFYNSRLQMVDLRGDKYLLVLHDGGDLILELSNEPPWYWYFQDILLDSLDSVLIFSLQSGGERIGLVFGLLLLGWVGWMVFKGRLEGKKTRLAIWFGAAAVILHGLYIYLRLDQVTMISKTVVFDPLSLLTTFLLVACGALIYFHSRGWPGKAIAIAVVSFHFWSITLSGLVMLGVINWMARTLEIGAGLYNYSLALLPGASLPVILVVSGCALWLLGRTLTKESV